MIVRLSNTFASALAARALATKLESIMKRSAAAMTLAPAESTWFAVARSAWAAENRGV